MHSFHHTTHHNAHFIEYITADKVSVGIFPEGSRGVELQEFKPGSFKIAEKTRCPVVVCCMKGTGNIHVNWPWRKTDVYMDILEVIDPKVWKEKDTVQVASEVQELIQKKIDEEN